MFFQDGLWQTFNRNSESGLWPLSFVPTAVDSGRPPREWLRVLFPVFAACSRCISTRIHPPLMMDHINSAEWVVYSTWTRLRSSSLCLSFKSFFNTHHHHTTPCFASFVLNALKTMINHWGFSLLVPFKFKPESEWKGPLGWRCLKSGRKHIWTLYIYLASPNWWVLTDTFGL